MDLAHSRVSLLEPDDLILITGANGFIGSEVVTRLLQLGFRNLRCLTRPTGNPTKLQMLAEKYSNTARIEIVQGQSSISPRLQLYCSTGCRGVSPGSGQR